MNTEPQQQTDPHHLDLVRSTEAMLDYAIVAGAELRNPMLVRFVQLARRALLDQEQPDASDKGSPDPGGKQ
jgi:hypothetical protein